MTGNSVVPPVMPTLPDRSTEQAFHSVALAAREWMRNLRMSEARNAGAGADPWTQTLLNRMYKDRADRLPPREDAAFFGSFVDERVRRYVGYEGVYDRAQRVLVVNWKAPEGDRFMGATSRFTRGLLARRAFTFEGHNIVDIRDQIFDETISESVVEASREPIFSDALRDELERSRDGAMRDIVRTMGEEQYALVSAPFVQTMAVQGGPGTGKSAIALHRASVWKYRQDLAASEVLIIGPSKVFLEYISGVLPALGDATGEGGVRQMTIHEVGPKVEVNRLDSDAVRRLKGELAMLTILNGAIEGRIRREVTTRYLVVSGVTGEVRLPVHGVNQVVAEALQAIKRQPYEESRAGLASALRAHAARWIRAQRDREEAENARLPAKEWRESRFVRAAVDEESIRRVVDDVLPPLAPARLLRELFESPERLAKAASGRFTEDQLALLRRSRGTGRGFSVDDIPLLDYLERRIFGAPSLWKMVVVDEAQDLSPMQLQMVGSRCPSGAITLVGDIAQATGPWARDSWHEVIQDVTRLNQRPVDWHSNVQELTVGYRVPAPVLDFATRLLPSAAPGVSPPIAIRPGEKPRIINAGATVVVDAIGAEVGFLLREGHSVCVIASEPVRPQVVDVLRERGIDVGHGSSSVQHEVVVIDPISAKGLEFDAVIVVEPAAIAESDPRGERLLYIALTRCTQALTIIHSRPYSLLGIGTDSESRDRADASGPDPAFDGVVQSIAASIRSTVLPTRWAELIASVARTLGLSADDV